MMRRIAKVIIVGLMIAGCTGKTERRPKAEPRVTPTPIEDATPISPSTMRIKWVTAPSYCSPPTALYESADSPVADIKETAQRVTITINVSNAKEIEVKEGVCRKFAGTQGARMRYLDVELARPLGNRVVRDGACGLRRDKRCDDLIVVDEPPAVD